MAERRSTDRRRQDRSTGAKITALEYEQLVALVQHCVDVIFRLEKEQQSQLLQISELQQKLKELVKSRRQ